MTDTTSNFYRTSGKYLLAISFVMLLLGNDLFFFAAFVIGLGLYFSQAIINGSINAVNTLSNLANAEWPGELLHVHGIQHPIRYSLDHNNIPMFVAMDICEAIGKIPPGKNDMKIGSIALQLHKGLPCFTQNTLQEYLLEHASGNRDAMLILARIKQFNGLNSAKQ